MRLFIAIKIPSHIQESLARFIAEVRNLADAPRGAQWVRPENIHLTLKFLGEVAEDRVEALAAALRPCADREPFEAEVRGAGAFPSWKRPRVFWAGIPEAERRLSPLASDIDRSTLQAGFAPADHPFSAHLTLARFPEPPRPGFAASLRKFSDFSFGSLAAGRFFLIRSRLGSVGPDYSDLREFAFHEAH